MGLHLPRTIDEVGAVAPPDPPGAAGQVLAQEGHALSAAIFIERGLVDIFSEGELVDTLGPGDCLGEAALLPVPPGAAEVRRGRR